MSSGDIDGVAAGADGGTEAGSVPEPPSSSDGASDAGADGTFCSRVDATSALCRDFDDVDATISDDASCSYNWCWHVSASALDDASSADLATIEDASVSAPRSLRVDLSSDDAGSAVGRLTAEVWGGPTNGGPLLPAPRTLLSFDALFESTSTVARFAGIDDGCGSIALVAQSGMISIASPRPTLSVDGVASVVVGRWMHVAFDFDSSRARYTLTIDEHVVATHDDPAWVDGGACTIFGPFAGWIGLDPRSSMSAAVRFDNVVLECSDPHCGLP